MGYAERGQAPHILAGLPPSSERSTLACKGWRACKGRMDQAEVKPSLWTDARLWAEREGHRHLTPEVPELG